MWYNDTDKIVYEHLMWKLMDGKGYHGRCSCVLGKVTKLIIDNT
jgi:hypothetical protein